jgi:DNA (cytosine-5)-methyltransferase 1
MGYHRAGFDVVGVDIKPQPNYPFEFVQADALEYCDPQHVHMMYDAIHASPPCQAYTTIGKWVGKKTHNLRDHPDLYGPTREMLHASGLPWVIENVIGAPYTHGVTLCGSMFDLPMRRHRNFETSFLIFQPSHRHNGQKIYAFYGHGGRKVLGGQERPPSREGPALFGMPWAKWDEIVQAIPPAYTQFIGEQLLAHLGVRAS